MLTTTNTKLYGLDHLRAFAILIVFLFHYQILSDGEPTWLPDIAKFGWTGVDLFFVLSGFLISTQLFSQLAKGRKISFSTFFLKRFFRIIPAYLVVVVIYFSLPLFREKEALPALWKFLTFTQNFDLNLKEYGTFSHAWSLCVEEHFYLLLPLALFCFQTGGFFKKGYWLLIALFLLGFAIRIYSFNELYLPTINLDNNWMYWYKYIYYPSYNRFDGLLIGVTIAALYQFLPNQWDKIARYGNWFLVLSLVVLTGAYFLCDNARSFHASVFGFPLVALGYGLMVIAAISPASILYKWNSKVTSFIATLSYAIYLSHKGVIHITHWLLADYTIDANLMLVICIVTCTLAAIILNLVVEKPFMKLRNRILDKQSL